MKIQNRNKKILSLAPKIRNTKNFRKKNAFQGNQEAYPIS